MSVLWKGRFEKEASDELWSYTASQTDRRLLAFDIQGSKAHVRMLAQTGIISASDGQQLQAGLETLEAEARSGTFQFTESDEDVHSAVERRLTETIGEVASKLHTGRSRNDQVLLDVKLYLRSAVDARLEEIKEMISILIKRAEELKDVISPAYTHLQQAQVIPFSHHLLAYAWMLKRDFERLSDARTRINVSPLGAGAVGGSSLPLDPSFVAKELGFSKPFDNSVDATASRDFVSEYIFCAAQTMVNLSRLSEELVLWNTKEFGWITLPDDFATGSSMLPQKKNPDIAELARGRSSVTIGNLMTILTLQKGVPLAYNRDFQGDKDALFQADDTLSATLRVLTALLANVQFHIPKPDSSILAIDLAEQLVSRGVPFRQAHHAVGGLVASLAKTNRGFDSLTETELTKAHPLFQKKDFEILDGIVSVQNRKSPGGGSFSSVQNQIKNLKKILEVGKA